MKHTMNTKVYELSNHLGNVLVTVADARQTNNGTGSQSGTVVSYSAIVVSANDYSAFGAPMPGRTYSSPSYRYGFNGQEKDDEVTGNGGATYTAMFWEYDARLGRRWNTDPVVHEWESPYATFNNCPIIMSDPNGDEPTTDNAPPTTSAIVNQGATIELEPSIAWSGSDASNSGTTLYTGQSISPIITTTSYYNDPDPEDLDYLGKKYLLEAAQSVFPDLAQRYLEDAMYDIGADELNEAVFDRFDEIIKSKLGSNCLWVIGTGSDGNPRALIGYDFIASLKWGSATGVNDNRNGTTNVIKRNYTRVTVMDPNIGLPTTTITEVPLCQPASDKGGLIRTANDFYIEMKVNDKYIFINFTIGEIPQQ
jgi:hypothetical protein